MNEYIFKDLAMDRFCKRLKREDGWVQAPGAAVAPPVKRRPGRPPESDEKKKIRKELQAKARNLYQEMVAPEKAQQVQENQDMWSGKRKAKQQKSFRSCNRTIPQKYKTIGKIKDKLGEAGHSEDAELPYGFWLELKKEE